MTEVIWMLLGAVRLLSPSASAVRLSERLLTISECANSQQTFLARVYEYTYFLGTQAAFLQTRAS